MRNIHCRTWNMVRNSEKVEKLEIHTLGPGVWQEYRKSWKMRNTNCRIWNTARNSGNLKNEKYTSRIWVMAKKKPEKREKLEMHTVGPGIW